MGLMSFDPVTIIINVVNVLLFFAVVHHFFWKPITAVMDKRQSQVDQDLDSAKEQNEAAGKLKAQYEESLASAKDEAAAILENARQKAKNEHDEAVKATKAETDKMVADAENKIEAERARAMKGMQSEIATIAMAAATKVIANNIDEKANSKYLDEFLKNEAGGKK